MVRIMCTARQQLENELNALGSEKRATERLFAGRQNLDPPEEELRSSIQNRYNAKLREIYAHESLIRNAGCGCFE